MMRTRKLASLLLFTVCAQTVALPALGQDDPITKQARARFQEGIAFYDKGQYENARASFLQAYALKKHPAVLLNLAQSSLKGGHPLEAAKYFQQYMAESTTATPDQRKDAERGLAEARQKLGRIEIVAPSGTEVTLDEGTRLGTAPFSDPVDVEPGSHTLKSPKETVNVHAPAGQVTQAKFAATSQAPAVVPAPVETPASEPSAANNGGNGGSASEGTPADTRSTVKHTNLLSPPANMTPVYIGLVAAGVGLVGTIVFAVFKAQAQEKADEVANSIRVAARPQDPTGICNSTDSATTQRFGRACTTLRENNDTVDTNAAIANISAAVMIVGAATAAGWYLFAPKREDSGPSSGKMTVTPYAGYRTGGLTLSASF